MKHCANPDCSSISRDGVVAEYTDEADRCSACAAPLVAGPAPEPSTALEWADLVRAERFYDLHAAHSAQALLRAENIDSFLANAYTSGVAWPYAAVGGGVQLYVHPNDLASVTELLESSGAEAADLAFSNSPSLEDACPRCGTPDPEPFARPRRWYALIGLLFGTLLPEPRKHALRCRACALEYFP